MDNMKRRVRTCAEFGQLRLLREDIQTELHGRLLLSDTEEWLHNVNRMHDAIIIRTIEIAENMLEAAGHGTPPVPYAFLLLGSGGRREQTLWSDQDNGLVYADGGDGRADDYFSKLTKLIDQGLREAGYPPCEGGVTASGELWRKPIGRWNEMIGDWFKEGTWESVRYLLIMADVRCVYGDDALVREIRQVFRRGVGETPGILPGMLNNTLRHKVVLGPLGNLIKERYGEDAGGFDIKYGAYIPMVNAIRLLSIRHGIDATPTMERIDRLIPFVGGERAEAWKSAFRTILKFRALAPYRLEDGFYTTKGKLRAADLTKEVASQLKACLHVGEQLQKYIKKIMQP